MYFVQIIWIKFFVYDLRKNPPADGHKSINKLYRLIEDSNTFLLNLPLWIKKKLKIKKIEYQYEWVKVLKTGGRGGGDEYTDSVPK